MGAKLEVVCLTATPDDDIDEGCERKLIDIMKFKKVCTSKKKDLEEPPIEEKTPLRTDAEVMKQVDTYRETRAVLIYANGDMNNKLHEKHQITRVTEDTPEDELR